MTLETNKENLGEMARCRWCDALIGLAYHVREHVCIKCFRRMRSENIPDNEIFGREEISTESKA